MLAFFSRCVTAACSIISMDRFADSFDVMPLPIVRPVTTVVDNAPTRPALMGRALSLLSRLFWLVASSSLRFSTCRHHDLNARHLPS